MTTSHLTNTLSELRLQGFLEALCEQRESTLYHDLSFEERLTMLVERELLKRQNNSFKKRLRDASLKHYVAVQEVDLSVNRKLKKQQLLELAQPSWITHHHNLIITGPTGIGKTFIASALAYNACRLGFSVLSTKLSTLLEDLAYARHEGSLRKLYDKLSKVNLLLIDEWLREQIQPPQAELLLDLFDSRFRSASSILVSQLPVQDWHQAIAQPTTADAILDRIVHDSHRLELDGPSMRKATALVSQSIP